MIPTLYEEDFDFTSYQDGTANLGLGKLAECITVTVRRVLNGVDELELSYPTFGKRASDLTLSRIIMAQPEYNTAPQPYRIYDVLKQTNGVIYVYARHVKEQLNYIPIWAFAAYDVTPAGAWSAMMNACTIETCPFTFYSNITTQADTFSNSAPRSISTLLGGIEGSMLDTYGGEYEFDRGTVKLLSRRGADNGVTLRYAKNIMSLKYETNLDDVVTAICPYWEQKELSQMGVTVTLTEKVIRGAYESLYPFKRTIAKDFSTEFEEEPTEAQLRAKAETWMNNSAQSVAEVTIDVNFELLNNFEEYKDIGVLDAVNLGDTVHIIYEHEINLTASARVIELRYDALKEKYKKVTLGKMKYSLADILNGL